MLTFWSYRHIPDIAPRQVFSEDLCQRSHGDNAKTRRNIGRESHDGCSCRRSPSTPNSADRITQYNNGRSIFSNHRRLRWRGELINMISIPHPNSSAYLVTFSSNCISKRHQASKLLHRLDADRGARELEGWKKKKCAKYFNFLASGRETWRFIQSA
jgi:hypothetical protein